MHDARLKYAGIRGWVSAPPMVDRWPCTGDRRETGEEDLCGPQFFQGNEHKGAIDGG